MSEGDLLNIELKFEGEESDEHLINFYDLAQALYGFERSLAITTHLVVNNEIITQATALRNARIFARPPKEGSFSIMAAIGAVSYAGYKLGTLKPDSPLGHAVYSIYDYGVRKVTGQPLDYKKSVTQLYEEGQYSDRFGLSPPSEEKLNSLAEKIEPPLTLMHRPIVRSETAGEAKIIFLDGRASDARSIGLDRDSFTRIKYRKRASDISRIHAKIAVFNPNTFNGRLAVGEEKRTIPFYLSPSGRSQQGFDLIGKSYSANLSDRNDNSALLSFDVIKTTTNFDRIVKYQVIRVLPYAGDDDHDELFDDYEN